jgi:hypothetical protein
LPEGTGRWKRPLSLEGLERGGIYRMFVHGDDTRWDRMLLLQDLAKKLLWCRNVPRRTQHEVNGMTLGIDRTVQIRPLLLNLDRGLVDAVRVVRRFQPWPAALLEFGGIAEIPADSAENDLGFTMVPLEE